MELGAFLRIAIPPEDFGLVNEPIILCNQVKTIDKKRLIKLYGAISSKNIQIEIVKALQFQPGF